MASEPTKLNNVCCRPTVYDPPLFSTSLTQLAPIYFNSFSFFMRRTLKYISYEFLHKRYGFWLYFKPLLLRHLLLFTDIPPCQNK